MAEHRLAGPALPVLNRASRGQWAAHCACGHIVIGMSAGHAVEYLGRHVDNPLPHETPAGRSARPRSPRRGRRGGRMTADDAEHYVFAFPLTNGPTVRYGYTVRYSQAVARCRCGWYTISIAETVSEYAQAHLRDVGMPRQDSVIYGQVAWR